MQVKVCGRIFPFVLVVLLTAASVHAADQKTGSVVDAGSFAILVKGQRVATETFKMEQKSDANTVSAQLRSDDPKLKAVQSAEMEVLANGALRRYTWKEISPGKAQIQVEPQDNAFLRLRVTESDSAPAKDSSRPLSPLTTNILDDNFFSHLQVLTWRYMAMGCKADANGRNQCLWGDQQMQVLNPHQQQSLVITFSYLGEQKMRLHNSERLYQAFRLQSENGEWMLWMDDSNKLVRVLIAAENTEVLRD
jgi:hypothetical protein